MSTPTPVDVPGDVVDWVTDIFRQCNIRISEKLTKIPNCPEESLDMTWVEHFSQYASPLTLGSSWTIKVETHFLGGLRHFFHWEIADIGILLFIRRGGRVTNSKVALLQSKRLYPTNNLVREEHRIDYEIGFARLADPENMETPIGNEVEYEFNEDCRFGALEAGSDQVRAIADYEKQENLSVYYQLYGPWSIPIVQRIPLSSFAQPSTELMYGVRVVPANQVHRVLAAKSRGHKPTLRELGTVGGNDFMYGWPLEYFAGELFLKCQEGSPFETIQEERIQSLFNRRSGAIYAAIAITAEEPVDQGAA
jgi:hypothetical protein